MSRYEQRDEQWGWVLVAITLGEISEDEAFKAILVGTRDNTLLAQRLTEAGISTGKRYQSQGDYERDLPLQTRYFV